MNKEEQIMLDELAGKAMQSMLTGIYGNEKTLIHIGTAAAEKKTTASAELADRAYLMALAMVIRRKEFHETKPLT